MSIFIRFFLPHPTLLLLAAVLLGLGEAAHLLAAVLLGLGEAAHLLAAILLGLGEAAHLEFLGRKRVKVPFYLTSRTIKSSFFYM